MRPADAPQQLASLQEQGRSGGKGGGFWRCLQSDQESGGRGEGSENTREGRPGGRGREAQDCRAVGRQAAGKGECAPPRALLTARLPPETVVVWGAATKEWGPQQRHHLELTPSRG